MLRSALFPVAEILLLAGFACAQNAQIFGGYSLERISACGPSGSMDFSLCHAEGGSAQANTYNGWNAAGTFFAHKFLGFTADFAGHYGATTVSGASASFSPSTSRYSYMFGPVASLRNRTYAPFAHVLFGEITNIGVSAQSYTNFAWAAGGGIDVAANRHLSVRLCQFDYERSSEPSSNGSNAGVNGFRVSTGIVLKP